MSKIKVWPHLTLVALAFALAGGLVAALWVRNEPTAQALSAPRAARVERVDGQVGVDRSLDTLGEEMLWEAEPNTPLTDGDRIYAGPESRAAVAFTGRNYARLDPETSLDVLSLSGRRTQLALRDGSAVFDLGALEDGELYEVATPFGAVELREPGLYHLGMNDDGSAFVSVLSGLAQVVGMAGSGDIGKGEMLTLLGQTAAQVALSRLDPGYAGGLLDDYYGYRYPDMYDGRYADYNAYLNDPYYYDPYKRSQSYRYVSHAVPGAWELDRYGDWQALDGYGHAWRPRVETGWAPYQQGQWVLDQPHGLTWVSSEPWGYAPYHYGRWANVGGQWYWVPERTDAAPAYAPALVAFLPLAERNQIAWVPLAPGDPYATPYYDEQWRPYYPGGQQAVLERVANFGVPGAVTAIPVDYFGRPIDPGLIVQAAPSHYEQARPVAEPLSHAMLRQASLTNAIARRGFVLPPGLAKRLGDTRVYASDLPDGPAFRASARRAPFVETVPEKQKRQKLQFKDERRGDVAGHSDGAHPGRGRGAQHAPAAVQESRGKDAREAEQQPGQPGGRGLMRRAERPEVGRQPEAPPPHAAAPRPAKEKPTKRAEQHAQGERVGHRPQPPAPATRQQGGPPPQARQRQEAPRPAPRQQAQPQPQAGREKGGPPAHAGKPQQQSQGGPGKGKGKGRP